MSDNAKVIVEKIQAIRDLTSEAVLVAVAGVPAAGKSTITEEVTARISTDGGRCVGLPMDGFHRSNGEIERMGAIKGQPSTFDAEALLVALRRLRTGKPTWWPDYTRGADDPQATGRWISPSGVILVEGNYLLLDRTPWREVAEQFVLRFFLDCPDEVIFDRLLDRQLRKGRDPDAAIAHVRDGDLPNAALVRQSRSPLEVTDLTCAAPNGG